MADIKNEFSWSISRSQLFQTCQRAYYYHYYGYWMGWLEEAPPRTRKIYILRNLKPLVLWAGGLVHECIKGALEGVVSTGRLCTRQELLDNGRALLRKGWKEAVDRLWLQKPNKFTNLFELYYGDGRTLPRETTDALKERVYDALSSFYFSEALKAMLAVPVSQWKTIDALDSFQVGDFKVFCALDAAYLDGDGRLVVLDWKTGGENPLAIRQQLACYALYAMNKWQIPDVGGLSLNGVYLNDGGRVRHYEVDEQMMISAQEQILASIRAMRSRLSDPEDNVAEEGDFPPCGEPATCMGCVFREICLEDN